MKPILIAISLFVLFCSMNTNNNQAFVGTYYGSAQLCDMVSVTELKWKLILYQDKKFEYVKMAYKSATNDSIKNEFIGNWKIVDDSILILNNILKISENYCPTDSVVYRISGNRLYSNFNCIDYSPDLHKYLEFLEKNNAHTKSNFIEMQNRIEKN